MVALALTVLAQARYPAQTGTWDLGRIAIAVVVIAALCALVFLALRYLGVVIPQIVWQVVGILFVAFIVICAIKILLSM